MARPTPELIDELFRDKVRQARLMSAEEKFLAGPRHFDDGCDRRLARMGDAFPDMEERTAEAILRICVNRVFG